MLINDMDEVIKLMEDTNAQGKIIAKYNHLEKIYNYLNENEAYIMLPNVALSNINDYINDLDLFEIKNQIFYIIGFLNKLSKDAENIDELKVDDIKILKDQAVELDEKIRTNWQQYIREKNTDILDSLILLEKLVDNKVQVLQLKTMINNIGKNWPVSKEDLDKYKVALNESTQLIDSLNVTDNVKDFLLLVTKGEATLGDIDDSIFDWLKKHNLIQKMKIQPI